MCELIWQCAKSLQKNPCDNSSNSLCFTPVKVPNFALLVNAPATRAGFGNSFLGRQNSLRRANFRYVSPCAQRAVYKTFVKIKDVDRTRLSRLLWKHPTALVLHAHRKGEKHAPQTASGNTTEGKQGTKSKRKALSQQSRPWAQAGQDPQQSAW